MADEPLKLDSSRCALIIQDLQNDVIIEGGAFAESGSPEHAKEQNVVENVKALAATARAEGHSRHPRHYIVEEGCPGLKLNAPLFKGVKGTGALVRGAWGAAAAEGLEPQEGDHVVEKMRMSAWHDTKLESLLEETAARHGHRHRSLDEHVHRAHVPNGRRQGLLHGRARGRLLDDERRLAQRVHQLRAPERLHRHDLRRGGGGARMSSRAAVFYEQGRPLEVHDIDA